MSQCINSDEIQPGDLSAYADGEVESRVAGHVRRCAFCRAQVAAYRRMGAALAVALDRAVCPAADTLGDFYLNALPLGQKLVVAKHLRECQRCAAELKEFDRPAPTDDWLAGLKGLPGVLKGVIAATFVPLRPQAVPRGDSARPHYFRAGDMSISIGYRPITDRRGVLSGVIISPTQTSLTPPTPLSPLQGERGGSISPPPSQGGGAGGGRSDLTPSPSPEKGGEQLSPPPSQGGGAGGGRSLTGLQVTLFCHGEGIGVQPAGELGHFVFDDVPPGEYDLAFDWDERVVLVTGIKAS